MYKYNRGDIHYVKIPYNTGSEVGQDRPAVIVSCDGLNHSASVSVVVFLTTNLARTKSTPGHVDISTASRPSIAMCEQIYTVSHSRFNGYVGHVTDEELAEIEKAIMRTCGIIPASPIAARYPA